MRRRPCLKIVPSACRPCLNRCVMHNPIIVALDVPKPDVALELVEQLAPVAGAFKVGKELFVSAGSGLVRRIRATGAAVFLDLKFHDIPNTVAKAVAAGANWLVIGRPIYAAENPRAAAESILASLHEPSRP